MIYKLFICYSNVDTPDVNRLIAELKLEFLVWSDRSVKPGRDIWDEQLTSIENCDAMLFLLTSASLASEATSKQLNYAWRINCPIIPLVVNWQIDNGRRTLSESLKVPEEITESQNLYYIENELADNIKKSLTAFEVEKDSKYKRLRLARPKPLGNEDTEILFNLAEQAARSLKFNRAIRLFKQLSKNPDLRAFSEDWQTIITRYQRICNSDHIYNSCQQKYPQQNLLSFRENDTAPTNSLTFKLWHEYQDKYPKNMPLFDPLGYNARAVDWEKVPGDDTTSKTRQQFSPKLLRMSNAISVLPEPFSWITVPEQHIEHRGPMRFLKNESVKPSYRISKYPVTVSQFATFLEDNAGYDVVGWWAFNPEASFWRVRQDAPKVLGHMHPESPRTFITWYEAMAFCTWLSDKIRQRITLPTVEQWEYAASQGDGRTYPWGNSWDYTCCNNSVSPCESNGVSQVTRYDGLGESPLGVSDMVGNVWEWCLDADYKIGNQAASTRSMRGGSLNSTDSAMYTISAKNSLPADNALPNVGFRIVMNLS